MSWRDQLQQASFRGVNFFVDSHEYSIGRRNVVHQYPFRDKAFVEDLGLDADKFSITGYILAKPPLYNYFRDRDKLIEVLKKKGTGTLVHRYLGKKTVALVGQARVSESFAQGGIARFSMTFVEGSTSESPTKSLNPVRAMDLSALDAIASAVDAFSDIVSGAGAPLAAIFSDITNSLIRIKLSVRTLRDVPASVISQALATIGAAQSLMSTVLSSPCDVANTLLNAYDSFLFAAGMLEDTVGRGILGNCSGRVRNTPEFSRASDSLSFAEGSSISEAAAILSGFPVSTTTVKSVSSAKILATKQAYSNMNSVVSLANAARVAVRIEFGSQEDAEAEYRKIDQYMEDKIESLGEEAGDTTLADMGINYANDEFYRAIKSMQPVLSASMRAVGAGLANKVDYVVPPDGTTSIVLAYDRYGDVTRDTQIAGRNKTLVFHPGFLPAGKSLSLLTQ
jgi:prophage DNA circulation protein